METYLPSLIVLERFGSVAASNPPVPEPLLGGTVTGLLVRWDDTLLRVLDLNAAGCGSLDEFFTELNKTSH